MSLVEFILISIVIYLYHKLLKMNKKHFKLIRKDMKELKTTLKTIKVDDF